MAPATESVQQYLDGLAPERREAVSAVRDVILANLPAGYEESIDYGMLSYAVPLATYPETYNGKPLSYAALASQKNYMALYLMSVSSNPETEAWFVERYRATANGWTWARPACGSSGSKTCPSTSSARRSPVRRSSPSSPSTRQGAGSVVRARPAPESGVRGSRPGCCAWSAAGSVRSRARSRP